MIALFFFYTILLEIIYFLLSPILFAAFRNKPNSERLAIEYPRQHFDIIVHAASVGEINGIKQLLKELINLHPQLRILLTTNTKTGRKAGRDIHPNLEVMISPLDVLHLRIKQIQRSRPKLILIAETEIWPQLLYTAKLYNIPIVYINARMSLKHGKKYYELKPILSWLGSSIRIICSQSEADRERFSSIFNTECIRTGNLKFSVIQPDFNGEELRNEWGYKPEDKIITVGSSRPGEELLLSDAFYFLKGKHPNLKLIIAPRHLDRLEEIKKILIDKQVSLFSDHAPAKEIHIIDEMGHLLPAYAMSDIAIIGGSFYPFGGHNPLEAAFYGKMIVMGPYHDSCLGSVKKLKKADAIVISSVDKLKADLDKILSGEESYLSYGNRAKQVLEENRDSLPKHLEIINRILR